MSDDYRSPTAAECEMSLLESAHALRRILADAKALADEGGRAGWLAFSQSCAAADLAEVRLVAGWPSGEPPADENGGVASPEVNP